MTGKGFHKVIGEFDRITVDALGEPGSEWLTITMRVGYTNTDITMQLRSTEAVRDLHYALGRYLDHLEKPS